MGNTLARYHWYRYMHIVGADKLKECQRRHADCRGQIDSWVEIVERAEWSAPHDVMRDFPKVPSPLPKSRFVFGIKGNKYRVVARVDFGREEIEVRFADTHDEYDKIDAETF